MLHHWHGTIQLIHMALAEDEVAYDPTSSLLPDDLTGEALMMPKADGVLAGVDVALEVFRQVDPDLETARFVRDGSPVERGMNVAAIRGRMSSILRAERTALNFVQRMSGIATATNEFVRRIEGLPAQVIDTRKTVPGMRLLDKYAVRMVGGGRCRPPLLRLDHPLRQGLGHQPGSSPKRVSLLRLGPNAAGLLATAA